MASRSEVRPRAAHLVPALTGGVVTGVMLVAIEVSFAALIFSGSMSGFLARGIGMLLAGTMVATLVGAIGSSYPGILSPNQDVPVAILAVVATGIAGSMATSGAEETFFTVMAAVVVTAILTGSIFFIQGLFKLGALFRFLPYPVVGGFLAGTGWLLTVGGIGVMGNVEPAWSTLALLFEPQTLLRWAPGAVFALILLAGTKRSRHYLTVPLIIVAAMALFYALVVLLRIPFSALSAGGWLLGPFPPGALWRPLPVAELVKVNWSLIAAQGGNIVAVVVVSTVALLLNASGLELTVEQDIDLDRELQVSGLGAIASGLVGGSVSYASLGTTTLGYNIGGSKRLLSLVCAAVVGVVLALGPAPLALLPKMLVGGMLVYLGLSFLLEWVYRGWFRLSRLDYLMVITILVVVSLVGFLEGVLLGIVLSVLLFVINYSRVNVVKHSYSCADYQSRVTRRRSHRQILTLKGNQVYVLQLQGFIFFGTANGLLEQVRRRLEAGGPLPLKFVLLDFRQVTGVDSTAALSFNKMKRLARTEGFTLVFTHTEPEGTLPGQDSSVAKLFAQLREENGGDQADTVKIFPDLDRGLEWCENQLLLGEGVQPDDDTETLQEWLQGLLPERSNVEDLLTYFESLDVMPGGYLMKQGDEADDMYFIESGQVTAQLEGDGLKPIRLETMHGGRVVGEIGFYLDAPRTAAVVADAPSRVYRLSKQRLEQMEEQEPEVASAFHQAITRLLSERVTHLVHSVDALQR